MDQFSPKWMPIQEGGTAISIAHATNKPILFLGLGQEYDDIVKFDPQWLVSRLFGEAET